MPGTYLTVVIPGYNEDCNIEPVVKGALDELESRSLPGFEILLINDGSTDRTSAVMRGLAEAHSTVRVFSHPSRSGLGAALKTGFAHARGDIITWIPGDGQYNLADVLTGLQQLSSHDLVIALREGRKESVRSFIILCFHGLLYCLFRFQATDFCGIYLIRRSVLEDLRPKANDIFLNLEIPLLCLRQRRPVGHITVPIRARMGGASKVANVRTILRNVWEMLKFRVRF